MLRRLITWSLEYPLVALLLAVGFLAAGTWSVHTAPWTSFPSSPRRKSSSRPKRRDFRPRSRTPRYRAGRIAVNGVSGLDVLRSSSVQGLSVVTAVFHDGTPVLDARQLVGERLVEAQSLCPPAFMRRG